jgi:hypothetical protein
LHLRRRDPRGNSDCFRIFFAETDFYSAPLRRGRSGTA